MKTEKDLNRVSKIIINTMLSLFHAIIDFVNIGLKVFIIFGAAASLILLFKMYPDMYLILHKPLFKIFEVLWLIIKCIVIIMFFLFYFYIITKIAIEVKKYKKNIERKKKQFMDDLVKKLKKEIKK